jgi:pterin-4a-carbinolamine dehydratase
VTIHPPPWLQPRHKVDWEAFERRGWRRRGEALEREIRFRDFDEASRFIDQVAECAVDYGRRPDMSIHDSNRVRLSIANPHHAGLTLAEERLATKVDAVIGA